MNRDELIWAAGFFDGEGCIHLKKDRRSGRSLVGVDISQVRREPLERFQAAIGHMGKINGPYLTGDRIHPLHYFRLGSWRDAQAAMAMLWAFLSTPKREQAIAVMRKFRAQPSPRGHGHGGRRREVACRNGHSLLDPANLRIDSRGWRHCRVCQRLAAQKWRAKQRERVSTP